MKSLITFAAGMLMGGLLLHTATAQGPRTDPQMKAVNHVGMVVENYDAALKYYKDVIGLREAYTVKNANGTPLLTYLQLNRETFVELIPARNGEKTGITHYGMQVGSIDQFVAQLRAKGQTVADPGVTPANARYVRVHDPSNVEIEVMEFGPQSLQTKAMESWGK